MERVCKFLKDAGTYYLATVEGEQPRVRPFGTAHIFEGRLYIQTGKAKPVSGQLMANPKAEICHSTMAHGCVLRGSWWRMTVWKPGNPCWMPIPVCGKCTTKTTAIPRYSTSKMPPQPSPLLRPHPKP